MAKSAWKFSKLEIIHIYSYLSEYKLLLKNKGQKIFRNVKNNILINNLNYMNKYIFHQGSSFVKKKFYPYCLRYTGYCFLKFTKPFHYKSKKKKK